MEKLYKSPFNISVLVAGLGFFIDAFDLFLFNIYRLPSLREITGNSADISSIGEHLLAIQMAGMMVGGIVSGVLADKKGRVYILYGSILLYSVCNIANGFVHDVTTYAFIRFLAGLGLAGELGAGITLVSEQMSIEKRGYGTILVASLGAMGAVCAGLAGDFLPWRTAFIAAGIAGLVLLVIRLKSNESGLFETAAAKENVKKGSLAMLFNNRKRFAKYLACILMGIPIWYSVGILITLTPELIKDHQIAFVKLSTCFILFQCGITVGDLTSGVLSQLVKSRKKILLVFMLFAFLSTIFHFYNLDAKQSLYISSLMMGLGCGYLSVFVTATAEHFGTNLRVTATATVTNFMRGAVTIMVPFHLWLQSAFNLTLTISLLVLGAIVWMLAFSAAIYLPETYGKSLDFHEE